MAKSLFILLLLTSLLWIHTHGQADTIEYKNQIKFSPVKLVDLVNPGIELSYERRCDHFSTQFTAAWLKDLLGNSTFQNYQGVKAGIEEKLFLNSKRNKLFKARKFLRPYVSAELAFVYTKLEDLSTFGYSNPHHDTLEYNYPDTFIVRKATIALNLKFGMQFVVKRIIIDLGFGAGVKYKNVKHDNRLVPSDEMEVPRHPNVYYISNNEMNGVTLSLPVSIRLGYSF